MYIQVDVLYQFDVTVVGVLFGARAQLLQASRDSVEYRMKVVLRQCEQHFGRDRFEGGGERVVIALHVDELANLAEQQLNVHCLARPGRILGLARQTTLQRCENND